MLIAVVIEAIIVGALGMAFTGLLTNSNSVTGSLSRSSDARFAAEYMISDARNSSGPEISLTDTTSCTDASPPVTGAATAVVRFNWNSTSSSGAATPNIADYVLISHSLLRRHCVNGSLVTDDVLAQNVSSVTAVCAPTADCSGSPTSITVTITETAESNGTQYQYSLKTAFRKLIGTGAPTGPITGPAPLFALGGSCNGSAAAGIDIQGNGVFKVYGNAIVNSAGTGLCPSINGQGGAINFQVTGTTSILSPGVCANGGSCPTYTNFPTKYTDPYAGMTPPSTSGQPSQAGCPGGTAQPGVYAGLLSITGACTLASGVYILQAGLTVGSTGNLTSAAGGVLLYVTGGSISVGGSATLTPQPSGAYAGVALWQPAANTSRISVTGSGTITVGGTLYAPSALMYFNGTTTTKITTLVPGSVALTSWDIVTIGVPPPTVTSTSPAAMDQGATSQSVAVNGTNFVNGASLAAAFSGTGITVNSTTYVSATQLTANITIAAGATLGARNVTVTNGDGGIGTGNNLFTVNGPPTVTSTSPNSLAAGANSQTVAVNGTNFVNGASLAAAFSGTGITVNSTTYVSATQLTANISIAAGATLGARNVTVTNGDGTSAIGTNVFTVAAAPTITSVTLQNGGTTQGKVEQSDKIIVVFSAQMSVSSFCTAWSGNSSNQTLSADNDVAVTLNDGGAGNDTITVASATCAFHFGTINLGTNAYISGGSATFKGFFSSKSTITWTAATNTLTITLGAKSGTGTSATVASSAPIYTATGITDPAGVGPSNSPYTVATAKQF